MPLLKRITLLFALAFTLHLPSAVAARSLVISVYPHNELAAISDEQFNKDYFQHWLDEMRLFTNHPIEVIFKRNVPGITDIDYSDMSSLQLLETFSQQIPERSYLNKHILLTEGVYDRSGLNYNAGLAYEKGVTAIASITTYSSAAHEIGHMLSATHEDAEVKFNGWVCETYTHPRVPLRSNCYRYSDKNRQNIADYIQANSR
ncbi:hypothetical protein [Pseudomonas sp. UM16]|uniref:hypothetical protein n=1 Tax=Pseudomonas sp. UM16 TaxID=3158962 RepID=UPI00398FBD56